MESLRRGWTVGWLSEIEAVQVRMPSGGQWFIDPGHDLWLRPYGGLEILYGLNGVGKSTVLKGVARLLGGAPFSEKTIGERVSGICRAIVTLPPPGELDFVQVLAREWLESHSDGDEDSTAWTRENLSAFASSLRDAAADETLAATFSRARSGSLGQMADGFEALLGPSTLVEPFSWLDRVRLTLARDLSAYYRQPANRDYNTTLVGADFERYGLVTPSIDFGQFERSDFDRMGWSSLVGLYAHSLLSDLDWELDERNPHEDRSWWLDDGDVQGAIRDPGSSLCGWLGFLRALIETPLLWVGRASEDTWSVGFAARLSDESSLHRELDDDVNYFAEGFMSIDGRAALGGYLVVRHRDYAGSGGFGSIHDPPVKCVDLDRADSLVDFSRKSLDELARLREAVVMLQGGVGEYWDIGPTKVAPTDLPGLDEVDVLCATAATLLRQLDIGVVDCQFRVRTALRSWVSDAPSVVEFRTQLSGQRWLEQHELSAAQAYWASAVFALLAARRGGAAVLIIADEPDRGVHERAAYRAFRVLSDISLDVLVASHSVSALRQTRGRLRRLEADPDGRTHVVDAGVGSDVATAADKLGTSPLDLLALKSLLVFVEGEHDVEIVTRLLGRSSSPSLAEKVLVVAARGVRNVATAAESVVLTQFTGMHVLAISDNGRIDALRAVTVSAAALISDGVRPGQVIAQCGIVELRQAATFEERALLDLVTRAIEHKILHRIHVYAVSTPDIIDALPVELFGLSEPWEELRARHKKSRTTDDFKSWLRRERGVSLSARKVGQAFDRLDAIPADLTALLSEIEVTSTLMSLE